MLTFEDSGTRSRHPRRGQTIASHIKLWDAITYPRLRHPPPAPMSSHMQSTLDTSRYHGNKVRRPIVWGLRYEVTILNKILVSFLSSFVINNPSYPYIGEVILQLSIEAMASHPNSTKTLPQLRTEYILLITSSSTTHYVCFLSGTVYNWWLLVNS